MAATIVILFAVFDQDPYLSLFVLEVGKRADRHEHEGRETCHGRSMLSCDSSVDFANAENVPSGDLVGAH